MNNENLSTLNLKAFVNKHAQFAFDFFQHLCKNSVYNEFFSPYSLAMAFSIVYEAADGETAKEIQQAFDFEEDRTLNCEHFSALTNVLKLAYGNFLYYHSDIVLYPSFVEKIKNGYQAEVETAEFDKIGELVDKVNQRIAKKTNNNLSHFLNKNSISSGAELALINAIHFKQNWVHPFSEENTQQDFFYLFSGEKIPQKMMYQQKMAHYYENELVRTILLPYQEGYYFFALLPNDNKDFRTVFNQYTYSQVKEWLKQSSSQKVNIYLPKFSITKEYTNLAVDIQNFGLKSAFSGNANFELMTSSIVWITKVNHTTHIQVDEAGTTVSAVTSVSFSRCFEEEKISEFRANRPFAFMILHGKTGCPVFLGQYTGINI